MVEIIEFKPIRIGRTKRRDKPADVLPMPHAQATNPDEAVLAEKPDRSKDQGTEKSARKGLAGLIEQSWYPSGSDE